MVKLCKHGDIPFLQPHFQPPQGLFDRILPFQQEQAVVVVVGGQQVPERPGDPSAQIREIHPLPVRHQSHADQLVRMGKTTQK